MLDTERVLKQINGKSLNEAFERFNRDVLKSRSEENASPLQPTPQEVKDDRSFRKDMMKNPEK